jgi:2'-5' RNA ligase
MPERSPAIRLQAQPSRARLFFALWPDEALRDAIYQASRGALHKTGGRLVPRENFHITLAFLGSLDAAGLEQAKAAAEEVNLPAFHFELDDLGYWPNSQVLWMGCKLTPEEPRALAHALRERLSGRALRVEPDKFTLHLTLARWVHKAGTFDFVERILWDVSEFALIRSETRARGVNYSVLGRWPLGRQGVLI